MNVVKQKNDFLRERKRFRPFGPLALEWVLGRLSLRQSRTTHFHSHQKTPKEIGESSVRRQESTSTPGRLLQRARQKWTDVIRHTLSLRAWCRNGRTHFHLRSGYITSSKQMV